MVSLTAGCNKDDGEGTETLPTISIEEEVEMVEGNENGIMSFTVSLNRTLSRAVSVSYSTSGISATSNVDFTAQSNQTLVFAAGEFSKTIDIVIVGDGEEETDESFQVTLFDPENGILLKDKSTGTILNDDSGFNFSDDGYTTPLSYAGMTLVWNDEFDGTAIDPSAWTHEIGGHGWGNNELQYYSDSPSNSRILDGRLLIEVKDQNISGNNYSSARMITAGKKEFQYGRIDIRAKLPSDRGMWPALWMLGTDFWTNGWPVCGEIDIVELVGQQPNRIHGTVHYGPDPVQRQSNGTSTTLSSGEDFSKAFHVFTILWEEDRIEWLVDDQSYHVIEKSDLDPFDYPFNKPFFFIMNVAVGGDWPGPPDATTPFPQYMLVDYVRVFQ